MFTLYQFVWLLICVIGDRWDYCCSFNASCRTVAVAGWLTAGCDCRTLQNLGQVSSWQQRLVLPGWSLWPGRVLPTSSCLPPPVPPPTNESNLAKTWSWLLSWFTCMALKFTQEFCPGFLSRRKRHPPIPSSSGSDGLDGCWLARSRNRVKLKVNLKINEWFLFLGWWSLWKKRQLALRLTILHI